MKRREALESCCRATDSSCVEGVVKGDCGMPLGILRVWVLCEEVEERFLSTCIGVYVSSGIVNISLLV